MAGSTHTPARPWSDDPRVFALLLTAIFLIASILNVTHHVMWRDETRAWQIAAASPTLAALHENLRYEGVPMLWYLILWSLTKITSSMLAMQIVHVMIAAGVVFTFAIAAPFGRVMKTLFAFGYFPFFEYATISRNYGLVFLFLLIGAAIASRAQPQPILLALVLVILSQASIWGAGFAALLMSVTLMQWTFFSPGEQRPSIGRACLGYTIVLTACAACYFQTLPGPGEFFIIRWHDATSGIRFMGSVGTIWKGLMPLPQWRRDWWNTNLLDDYYPAQSILAIALLFLAIACLARRPGALVFLIVGLGAQIAFTYFKFAGQTRHHGQLYMVLIVTCWLAERWPNWTVLSNSTAATMAWFDRRRNLLLGILLSVHAFAGIGASLADNVLPFSASQAAADYLRRDKSADVTLAGVDDYCMAPISAYLGRQMYLPQMRTFAKFNTQDDHERYEVSPQSVYDDIRKLIATDGHDVIFIRSQALLLGPDVFNLSFPATSQWPKMIVRVTLLKQFIDSTVPDETYSIYLFHRIE